jgi:hypothetical protein
VAFGRPWSEALDRVPIDTANSFLGGQSWSGGMALAYADAISNTLRRAMAPERLDQTKRCSNAPEHSQ